MIGNRITDYKTGIYVIKMAMSVFISILKIKVIFTTHGNSNFGIGKM